MNRFVRCEVEHVEQMMDRLRHADASELAAASSLSPIDAVLLSMALSTECFAWVRGEEEEVVAILGVAATEYEGVGCPWMVGTNAIREEREFLKFVSGPTIQRWNEMYPLLENYVHPDNEVSVRWLKSCGFRFGEPEPYGEKGELFLPFFKEL